MRTIQTKPTCASAVTGSSWLPLQKPRSSEPSDGMLLIHPNQWTDPPEPTAINKQLRREVGKASTCVYRHSQLESTQADTC